MFWERKFSQSNKMKRAEFMTGIHYLKKEDIEKPTTFKLPYDESVFKAQQWLAPDISFNTIVASEASIEKKEPETPPHRLPVGKT
jgi:hypothetical protein